MGISLEAGVDPSALLGVQNEDTIIPLTDGVQHILRALVEVLHLVGRDVLQHVSSLFIVADDNDWLLFLELSKVLIDSQPQSIVGSTLADDWVHDWACTLHLLVLALE
jgi:hypothetical protein